MSYREKLAWLTLVSFAVTYAPYFTIVGLGLVPSQPLPNPWQLILFAAAAITQWRFWQSVTYTCAPMRHRRLGVRQMSGIVRSTTAPVMFRIIS